MPVPSKATAGTPYFQQVIALNIDSQTISNDIKYLNKEQLQNRIKQLRKQMETAVKETEFLKAAEIRDQILAAEKMLKEL